MWRGGFYRALIDTEQGAEHPGLPVQVLSGDPKYLPFANHLYRLNSRDDCASSGCRPRALHGPQASFDVPVVGFDAIICVGSGSVTTTMTDLAFVLQFSNGGWITSQSVSSEYVWRSIIGIRQGSHQEAFGGFPIASCG